MPVIAQQPYLVARLMDDSESRAELRLHVRSNTGRAAGVAAARQLADLVNAASDASVYEHLLRYPTMITGGAAAPGSSDKNTGVLIFSTTDPNQYGIIEIFGIKPELIDPEDSTALLLTAPALQAYISALISGPFTNPFGYPLVECIAGLFQLRQ